MRTFRRFFSKIFLFFDLPQYSNTFDYIRHRRRAIYFNNQKNHCISSLREIAWLSRSLETTGTHWTGFLWWSLFRLRPLSQAPTFRGVQFTICGTCWNTTPQHLAPMVGWDLTALLTQIRSYCAFKVITGLPLSRYKNIPDFSRWNYRQHIEQMHIY